MCLRRGEGPLWCGLRHRRFGGKGRTMPTSSRSHGMDHSLASRWTEVVLCLLIQASIVGGGEVLNRWLAPAPVSPCCAPPLVL